MNWIMKLCKISFQVGLICCLVMACNKPAHNQEISSRVSTLPYYNEASFTPKWLAPNSSELENFHSIPDFDFISLELKPLPLSSTTILRLSS